MYIYISIRSEIKPEQNSFRTYTKADEWLAAFCVASRDPYYKRYVHIIHRKKGLYMIETRTTIISARVSGFYT